MGRLLAPWSQGPSSKYARFVIADPICHPMAVRFHGHPWSTIRLRLSPPSWSRHPSRSFSVSRESTTAWDAFHQCTTLLEMASTDVAMNLLCTRCTIASASSKCILLLE
jgi:hypothetical protein